MQHAEPRLVVDTLSGDAGHAPCLKLDHGSEVAVIGGGPAGAFFSYFLLQMAQRVGVDLAVDVFEWRDFSVPGPSGCNMCGGIVSESLVQTLAAEGIHLPATVVQRGIDSYFLHMDVGSVRIETPLQEMRIAAVHRGSGPRGIQEVKWRSLDGYLLGLALDKGACLVRGRVDGISWENGRPWLKTQAGFHKAYDLLVAATGINTAAPKLFEDLGIAYKPPRTTKTYLCEFCLGGETIKKHLGNSMHVFLLNIPRLEFAAFIPKGEFVTGCLLGEDIDKALILSFLNSPQVRECLPPGWQPPQDFCHCSPRINIRSAIQPFADRVVFVGDCGATRLYKDGIGAAYRTAKAAAKTAIFEGISAEDFRRHYWPVCRGISIDNQIGKFIFTVTRQIQKTAFLRRGVWRMVSQEQRNGGRQQRMSSVLWDTFTGSAPYRHVLLRALHPAFLGHFLWDTVAGNWALGRP